MSAELAEAAAHWRATSPRLLAARENHVYAVDLPTGRAALRLHRLGYHSGLSIRSELWLCRFLADTGLRVASPVATTDGSLVVELRSGRFASAVSWVEGQPLPLETDLSIEDCDGVFEQIGVLLAEMHDYVDTAVLPEWFSRPSWDIGDLLGDEPRPGRFWEHPALTAEEKTILTASRSFLKASISTMREELDFGLVHADIAPENVLFARSTSTLIDFDDCGWGFRAYDLGCAVSHLRYDTKLNSAGNAILRGYDRRGGISVRQLSMFLLLRRCVLVAWAVDRRSPDHPIHRLHIENAVKLAVPLLDGAASAF